MMTDVWNGCSENDNENSCDSDTQQELECYLYSLVHHDYSVGEDSAPGRVEEISPSVQNPEGPQRGWRYFSQGSNVTPYQSRNVNFNKRLEELSERYNCNPQRGRGPSLRKNPYWRQRQPASSNRFEEMDHSRNKPSRLSPNLPHARGSPIIASTRSSNIANARSSPCTNNTRSSPDVAIPSNSEIPEISSIPANPKDSEVSKSISLSSDSVNPVIPSCPPGNADQNLKEDGRNQEEISKKENAVLPTEENDDLNNTNPSLSSFDDCFELPQASFSKPKSKSAQNLNDCMTQVLGSMLDEDASRSSIESDKRPIQKPSKNGSGSGWTVGMSWEDMSSKFRFNFEADSVCGDSVREGSVSSRANSPDPCGVVMPEEDAPADVTKYNVSLKTKEDVTKSMTLDEESDSDVDSVVEVTQPDKEPPVIVEISSDTEDVVPAKTVKLDDDPVVIEEDIMILYEAPKPSSNRGTSSQIILTPDSRDPKAGVVSKKRERLRKKAKRQWEGEREELETSLAGMSDDPRLWRICREDVIGKPSPRKFKPCDNCKQRDHGTWKCPEPVKIKVCLLCARPGHNHYRCPDRMCLNCGAKAPSSVKRCHLCLRNNQICNICKWPGHSPRQCPDLWRRYRLTTSIGPPVTPAEPDILSPAEAWCCNCAKKGHYSHDCTLPCSPINERIFSHVMSYADPTPGVKGQLTDTPGRSNALTPGRSNAPTGTGFPRSQVLDTPKKCSAATPKSLSTKSPAVPKKAEAGKSSARPDSPAPRQGPSRVLPKLLSPQEQSGNFFDSPVVQKNYALLVPKLHGCNLPSQPDALADFLQEKLELLKKPMLRLSEVKLKFSRLTAIMGRAKLRKTGVRQAITIASQLNMTVLGYGKLGDGDSHVSELQRQVAALRQKTGKVAGDVRAAINHHFTALFKGCIRNDLKLLVNEYLKQERSRV